MPDLLMVILIPPGLILSTLLLAHLERRVIAPRPRPGPTSPGAALVLPAPAQPAPLSESITASPHRAGSSSECRHPSRRQGSRFSRR
jgi:hypothetical protein